MNSKKKIIIVVLAIAIVILSVVIAVVTINRSNQENDGAGQEIYEKSAVFNGRDAINAAIGPDSAAIILDNLSNFIFSDAEMQTAQHANEANYGNKNYYGVEINNVVAYSPNYTYKFTMSVSDGRKYDVSFRTDDEYGYKNYIIVSVKNMEKNGSAIYFNAKELSGEKELVDWMIDFAKLDKEVEVINKDNPLIN